MLTRSIRLSSTIQYAAGRLLPAAITVITTPILARMLEPKAYGDLALALSITTTVGAALFGWCEPVTVRELSHSGPADVRSPVSDFLRSAGGTLGLIAGTALTLTLLFGSWNFGVLLPLMIAVSCLFGIVMLITGAARALDQASTFVLISTLANGGRSLAGILVALVGFSVARYFWGWIALLIITVALGVPRVGLKWHDFIPRVPSQAFIRYIVPASGVAISILLLQLVDRLTLNFVVDRSELGVYTLGYAMTETGVVVVFSVLHTRRFPLLLQLWATNRDEAKRLMTLSAYVSACVPLAIAPALAVLGATGLKGIGGAAFAPTSSWFMVYVAIGLGLYGAGQWITVSLQFDRLTNRWFISTVSGVLVNAMVILVLGDRLGITAGGIATLCAYGCMLICVAKLSPEPDMWHLSLKAVTVPLLASVLGITGAIAFSRFNAWIGASVGSGVYLLIVGYHMRKELRPLLTLRGIVS